MAISKYIRIPIDFFDSEPIKQIEEHAEADVIILLYLQLLCDSHRKNRKGVFEVANVALSDDLLEHLFNVSDIGVKLDILEEIGLIRREETKITVYRFWADLHDRNSAQYRHWRNGVFTRDNFTCQSCGAKGYLQAHHIKGWKNNKLLRYAIANGVTLCRKCHLEAHGGCWRNG